MKFSVDTLAQCLLFLPGALAWGDLGHHTTGYLASYFISSSADAYFKDLLKASNDGYLANVSTWADKIKYTKWGAFSRNFHFIDAHDQPASSCNVNYVRDCKRTGCVVSALANYTQQAVDPKLAQANRAEAAKFLIHFIGDLHQPLHNEDAYQGGNGIHVCWDNSEHKLHEVWDTEILEKLTADMSGDVAQQWAKELATEITKGKFAGDSQEWLKDFDLNDPDGTAMIWSAEANKLVCTTVLPKGPKDITYKELSNDDYHHYYGKASAVVEEQIARAGFRMAAWLDAIAKEHQTRRSGCGLRAQEL